MVKETPDSVDIAGRRVLDRLSLWEKILALTTAAFTLATAIFVVRSSQVTVQRDDLRGIVDSLERRNAVLDEENAALNSELATVAADRDRWKARAEATSGETPPPVQGGGEHYEFEFADNTFFDFDRREASRDGGADYEVKLNFGRFFYTEKYGTWADVRIIYIKTSEASYAGCEGGTDLQSGEVAHLDRVEQDESICVSTSDGEWAVLKIGDIQPSASGLGMGNITFDVQLFSP